MKAIYKNKRSNWRLTSIFLAILFFLIVSGDVKAAPAISSVSGNIIHNQTITISGSGFGTKDPAAPLKWDNFESGTNGNALTGWYIGSSHGIPVSYANDQLRGHSQLAAKHNFTSNGQYNCSMGLTSLTNPMKYYVSLLRYIEASGGPTRNYKDVGFRPGNPGDWQIPGGGPEFSHAWMMGNSELLYAYNCGSGSEWSQWISYSMPEDQWNRYEYYVDAGDKGVANGEYSFWLDGVLRANNTRMFYSADCPEQWTNIYIDSYHATDTNGATAYIWNDDVYIDITQARVEICSGSSWANRVACEIQIPSGWGTNSLAVTVNRGVFGDGQNVYLYVVDSNGEVNANGYPVSIGGNGGGDSTPPAAPSGLVVN